MGCSVEVEWWHQSRYKSNLIEFVLIWFLKTFRSMSFTFHAFEKSRIHIFELMFFLINIYINKSFMLLFLHWNTVRIHRLYIISFIQNLVMFAFCLVPGASTIRYRKSIQLFDRYTIKARVRISEASTLVCKAGQILIQYRTLGD